jgi:hypothetical protein
MKKILGIAALAAVVSGCLTHVANEEVKPYRLDDVKSAPVTDRPYVEGATLRPLRVLISMDGGPREGSPEFLLSGYLQSHLEGELARRGYRVVYDRPSEMLVSTCGPVTCQLLNKRGSRVVFKGDVDLQVTREAFVNKMKGEQMKDVIARRRFDMKGRESRGRPDATDGIKSVADGIAPEMTKWAAESVTRVAGALERCEFTICNGWNYRGEEEYPSRFVRTVNAIKGVYECRVIQTDNVRRSIRVEVIYERDMFPEGFVNSLYTVRELDLYR